MATRASARIKSKGQATLVLDDSGCANQDDETFEVASLEPKKKPQAGKRQRTGKSSSKKKVNNLEAFASMPLDILCLIMEQMDPKTLLAMSRTCSMFRSILHSPRGQTVWKCAREQVGLSALQRPDVPEWGFASLLFEPGCVVCGSGRAFFYDYVHFVRTCEKCMQDNSKQREYIKKSLLHPRAFEVVPYSLCGPPSFSVGMDRHFWWKPRLERATVQLDELEADPEALERLIASRKNIQKQAQADEAMIERWQLRCQVDEAKAEEERKTIRIIIKLRDLGYEEQDLHGPALANHPDVCNSRPLTYSVWKRIRPILKRFLDANRIERLEKEAIECIEERKLALRPYFDEWISGMPGWYCYPPFERFLSFPSVAALLAYDSLTVEEFASAKRTTISRDLQQYAKEFEENVRHNLLVAYETLDPAFEVHPQVLLWLCTSAMSCPRYWDCKTSDAFPDILDHYRRCAGAKASIEDDLFTRSPSQIQAIRQIIAAANDSCPSAPKLSDASSMDDLFALGDRFDCVTCEDTKKQSFWYKQRLTGASGSATTAQSWSSMVWHIKHVHHPRPPKIRYIPPTRAQLEQQTPETADTEAAAV
ncbi:F-box protein [Sporobolomyces koalae]|uniref:F-box protein n=1 Tax=Sporobolomyces koalae TaxID=500713 RepID=UPI003173FD02